MINTANYNVVNNRAGGWDAKRDSAQRSSFHAETQREVELIAKRLASSSGGGEVRIQGRDGRWRDSDTIAPATDPFPPRDKKH